LTALLATRPGLEALPSAHGSAACRGNADGGSASASQRVGSSAIVHGHLVLSVMAARLTQHHPLAAASLQLVNKINFVNFINYLKIAYQKQSFLIRNKLNILHTPAAGGCPAAAAADAGGSARSAPAGADDAAPACAGDDAKRRRVEGNVIGPLCYRLPNGRPIVKMSVEEVRNSTGGTLNPKP